MILKIGWSGCVISRLPGITRVGSRRRYKSVVETNPYQSPVPSEPVHWAGGTFLNVAAFAFWFLGAGWAALSIPMALNARAAEIFQESPYSFVMVLVCVFLIPGVSLSLLGLALWRRRAKLAQYGLLLLIPTAILFGARFYFGTL
jgi:hypothetical protein